MRLRAFFSISICILNIALTAETLSVDEPPAREATRSICRVRSNPAVRTSNATEGLSRNLSADAERRHKPFSVEMTLG
jgi:hypothetical protein